MVILGLYWAILGLYIGVILGLRLSFRVPYNPTTVARLTFVEPGNSAAQRLDMSYGLNSLKGGYKGGYIGDYYRGY